MTKVERETLMALAHLGRRSAHTTNEITNTRLWMRTYPADPHPQKLKGSRPHAAEDSRKYSQYQHVTEKWLSSFAYRGLVQVCHDRVKAGSTLRLIFGPFYKITEDGQKLNKGLKRK